MHDRNGKPLAVGDEVVVRAIVMELCQTDDYCNVTLETIFGRRPDRSKERICAINTGVVEKV